MVDTNSFYDELIKNDITFFAGVPDSLLKEFCACIQTKTPRERNFITANEGNAVAMCAGWHLSTGKFGLVYMQNSGEGNAVNPLMSLTDADVYNIPLMLIIGWRGEPGVHDEPQHVKQGKVTIPLLDAMGIKHFILGDNYVEQIRDCVAYMKETNNPVALVVHKGSFSPYKLEVENNSYPLSREHALETVLSSLKRDDFVVSTTGKASREIFEIRERNKQDHSHDFLTVGSMGHTASIACGVAIGTAKNVFCVDGDGSFIMHMGSFPVIADKAPKNFKYIMINNGAHESVGGQPTVALKINAPEILRGAGFKKVIEAKSEDDIRAGIAEQAKNPLVAMIIYCHQGSRADLGRPTTTPIQNKQAFMKAIKE
jgi:phosphonopyruvate decarboxylase